MMLTSTFERRYRHALELEGDGEWEAALEALARVFDPLEDPSERRVTSAEFCMKVELRKAEVLEKAGRTQEALALMEADWTWRLANSADEAMRGAFLHAYDALKSRAAAPWRLEPAAVLSKLQGALFGPHRLQRWDALLSSFAR